MSQIALVAAGGALGAVARFGLSAAVQRWSGAALPWGTLAVNVSGCLVAGALAAWLATRAQPSDAARCFLMVGILGGFTTFSAFGLETWLLVQQGRATAAVLYVAASLAGSLGAVALGWTGARWLLT